MRQNARSNLLVFLILFIISVGLANHPVLGVYFSNLVFCISVRSLYVYQSIRFYLLWIEEDK